MNLTGVNTDQIRRGDVVCLPRTLRATLLADVEFQSLAEMPNPLKHNQRVEVFSGTAEIPARVRLLGREALEAGEAGWLQLRLEQPAVLAAGDRYILRQPSPSLTLGGGAVLDPHPRRRWRRFHPAVLERLETLSRGAPDEILLQALERHPLVTAAELIGHSGLGVEGAQTALAEVLAAGSLLSLGGDGEPLLLTPGTWNQIKEQLVHICTGFHRQAPLRRGMVRGEVRSRLRIAAYRTSGSELPVRLFNALLARARDEGSIEADENLVWTAGFQVRYTPEQQAAVDRLLAAFAAGGYSPPSAQESLALLNQREDLLESLIEREILVRLPGGVLFRRPEYEEMVAGVSTYVGDHGSITLAQARDLFGTSRKYVQAVLEEMDARRITRREGDLRVLRAG